MQMQPTKIQTRANNHSGCKSGVKQTCGLLYNVIQVHINPRRVSPKQTSCRKQEPNIHKYIPPTSVIIQSGIAKLTIAKTSAAIKSVPEIKVNLSIVSKDNKQKQA